VKITRSTACPPPFLSPYRCFSIQGKGLPRRKTLTFVMAHLICEHPPDLGLYINPHMRHKTDYFARIYQYPIPTGFFKNSDALGSIIGKWAIGITKLISKSKIRAPWILNYQSIFEKPMASYRIRGIQKLLFRAHPNACLKANRRY